LAFSIDENLFLSLLRVKVHVDTKEVVLEKLSIDLAKSYGVVVIATAWTLPSFI